MASHNGLKNITDVLGTNIYVNLRVGIGLPPPPNHPGNPNSVGKLHRGPKAYASYVLEDFTAQVCLLNVVARGFTFGVASV